MKNFFKKALRISIKILIALIALVVLFFATVFTVNYFALKSEAKKIEDYGQKVTIDGGHKMNVVTLGKGKDKPTIVLLPGYGTPSPGNDYDELGRLLDKNYQIVIVEPFGYGMSDVTETPRTTANMNKELHQVLQKLDIKDYTLMGHSIAGIYAIEYISRYGDEVNAFIGIDSSYPTQPMEDIPVESLQTLNKMGFNRLIASIMPDALMLPPRASQEVKDQVKYIGYRNMMNEDVGDEAKRFTQNFKSASKVSLPKDLPVFFIISSESDEADPTTWTAGHEGLIKGNPNGKIEILKGPHYLHHTQVKTIANDVTEFLDSHNIK
ncbi:alpha/beta fold hydrolase [Brochothrix thermosphacta]|uniref:alpha/beta fold hydrolase n=1 Tax=Brochothrix thermosphacta TaxID=2756 RepID=UPI00083F69DD|nr:alpha/beta hydrolase [Brochothrix thermosphacta]ODJ55332.1 hypothetical protein BFR41_06285 [Brochothrix thermosphacta]ODJ70648.1 hypothetical protein BFR43_06665 [Brochothrix thermosphacta]